MPCAPCSTNQRQETDMGHAHDHGHTHDDAPLMEDLLRNAPSNWGRWGPDDEIGALNFLTPAEVLRGVQSVKQGKVITIGMAIGTKGGDPVWPGRTSAQRTMILDKGHYVAGKGPAFPGGLEYADDM